MSLKQALKSKTVAAMLVAGMAVPLLAGCSGRDTEQSEKIAEINAAAARAEAAATRAEKAVAKLKASTPAPAVTEDAPDPEPEDNQDQADKGSVNSAD